MAGSRSRSRRNSTACLHVYSVTERLVAETRNHEMLPRTGTVLVREWRGTAHQVTVVDDRFIWNGTTYRSLSSIAHAITGTKWNGPRSRHARPQGTGVGGS